MCIMLTTAKPILGVTKDDKKEKLGTYKLYDFTKGGTDIFDQMDFLSCKTFICFGCSKVELVNNTGTE